MEKWKKIKDYEDYEVSNLGRIRSLKFGKNKVLKQNINRTDYFYLNLYGRYGKKKFEVHTLVAKAFCSNGEFINLVCDHIDRNKKNNKATNLRLVNYRTNILNREVPEETEIMFDKLIKLISNLVKNESSEEYIKFVIRKNFIVKRRRENHSCLFYDLNKQRTNGKE